MIFNKKHEGGEVKKNKNTRGGKVKKVEMFLTKRNSKMALSSYGLTKHKFNKGT